MKKVLAIHDISTLGRAGLNIVMPILGSFPCDVLPLPTCALSSVTAGFGTPAKTDLTDQMWGTVKHFKAIGAKFDYIYSGYLSNADQAEIVLELLRDNPNCTYFCDPVMADDGKLYSGYDDSIIPAIRTLVDRADICTPNQTEADFLGEIKTNAVALTSYKDCNVLCTLGGVEHLIEGEYEKKLITGAGDTFASFLLGHGISGDPFFTACEKAMQDTANYIDRLRLPSSEL